MSASHDEQQDDQAPAAPADKKPWRMKPRERLELTRRLRESHRFVPQVKVDEDDPEIARCIREGHAVTGPYDPFK